MLCRLGLHNVVFLFLLLRVTLHFCLTFCGCWFWSQISFQSFCSATWGLSHAGASQGLVRFGCYVRSVFLVRKALWYGAWSLSHECTAQSEAGHCASFCIDLGDSLLHLLSLHDSPHTLVYKGPFSGLSRTGCRADWAAHAAAPLLCYCRWTLRWGPAPGQSCQNKIN